MEEKKILGDVKEELCEAQRVASHENNDEMMAFTARPNQFFTIMCC